MSELLFFIKEEEHKEVIWYYIRKKGFLLLLWPRIDWSLDSRNFSRSYLYFDEKLSITLKVSYIAIRKMISSYPDCNLELWRVVFNVMDYLIKVLSTMSKYLPISRVILCWLWCYFDFNKSFFECYLAVKCSSSCLVECLNQSTPYLKSLK